jgi:4-amino-4-deoxy-L-arabinose transferase-like glycosyltransferase
VTPTTDDVESGGQTRSGEHVQPVERVRPPVRTRRWSPDDRRFALRLAPIMALGLAVRLAFVLIRQSRIELGQGDAFWYHMQARLVANGQGFLNPFDYYLHGGLERPGADHPPGFVIVLAALDWIGIDGHLAQRVVMCFVGTISIAVIAIVGRRLAGPRVGLIAGFLAAVYPNIWINDGMLMVETIVVLSVALALWGMYRYLDRPTNWAVVGIAAALTAFGMVRPEAVVVFPVVVVPMILARRTLSWPTRLRHLTLAALVPILSFAPWVAYNLGRFEKPVFLSTGAGQTFAVGNCDLTFSGELIGYWTQDCLRPPHIDPPTQTDPSLRDPVYQEYAFDYISEHRGELPKVLAARVARIWHLYRVDQSLVLDGYVEGREGGLPGNGFRLMREAVWSYYVLVGLGIAGCVILRRRRVPIYPLLAQPAIATFSALISFGITRYRTGFEVALVLVAAVALGAIWTALFDQPGAPEDPELPAAPEGSADPEGPDDPASSDEPGAVASGSSVGSRSGGT